MVVSGLADLVRPKRTLGKDTTDASLAQNQPLLSSSLQTAHNLGLLPDPVSNLLADLNDAVAVRVARAFDSAAIGREVAGKGKLTRSIFTDTPS
jgi:hypothetical protein